MASITSHSPAMSEVQTLLERLLTLPAKDRALIAHRLLDSLDDGWGGIDPAQLNEIQKRSDEVGRGVASLVPGDEALRMIRERKTV